MSRSIPAGGQITPFDWASLSLSGPELPPPTVGGSPLTSGGHVTPCSGDVFSVGCASTTPACAKPTNAAMIRMVGRKSQFLTHLRSVFVNVPRRNTFPPPTAAAAPRHLTFAQKAVAVSGSAATVLARTGRTEIVGTARWVARSKSPRNNPWPAPIPRLSLWAPAPLVPPPP